MLERQQMASTFDSLASEVGGVFGTENAAPLLRALVGFTRPRTVLEVGAGLTTLHLLKALKDNVEADREERTTGKNIYGKTAFYDVPYEPRLITVDDLSHPQGLAPRVSHIASQLQLDALLQVEDADFRGFSARIPSSMLPLDFVWFDCGGLGEYIDFTNEYWPLVNGAGGIVVFHSTLTNLELRLFITSIEDRHTRQGDQEFEILNLLEPHKKLQNSLSIIRMTRTMKTPLYTYEP